MLQDIIQYNTSLDKPKLIKMMELKKQPKISRCTNYNIEHFNKLDKSDLDQKFFLPCGCEQASLFALSESYQCSKCQIKYIYSFCLNEVVTEESTWHCEYCGSA